MSRTGGDIDINTGVGNEKVLVGGYQADGSNVLGKFFRDRIYKWLSPIDVILTF